MVSEFFRPGLVSITFRKLSPEELISLVVKAGQSGIEWGGDVHVPHGDIARAEQVGIWTRDAGLEVAAYGSYYRLGEKDDNPEFQAVLDSAVALGAPSIRVWAGKRASADADEAYRHAVKEDLARICAIAADADVEVALEYHANTLTDDPGSAREILESMKIPNLRSLWQPPNGKSFETCMAGLEEMLPHVSNVHVFHWGRGWGDRYTLAEGADRWTAYLSRLADPAFTRWALLEFVKDDSPEQYLRDAGTLKTWIRGISEADA
jgi:3-dehydroshikimate dehydratase